MDRRIPAPDSRPSWGALAGCCLVALAGIPALYGSTLGLFFLPLEHDLGWSRSQITFSLTVNTIVATLLLPVIGWLVDNVPLRPLILCGVLLQSINLAVFATMGGSVFVYYALCLGLLVTGTGASLLALSNVLQGWFDQALGRALGILFAAGAVGSVLHPQWIGALISHEGWRTAFLGMGGFSLVCGGLAAWFLVEERDIRSRKRSTFAQRGTEGSIREFLRDRTWWALAVWNLAFALAVGGILVHLAPLLQAKGLSLAQAASMLSLLGIGGFAGNLIAGWLIDRYSATMLARAFVLAPLGAVILLYACNGVAAAAVAALMLGVFSSGDHALSIFLARRYFKPEVFGRASATQMVATSVGGSLAPFLSAVMFDRTGSYDISLMASGAAFVLATIAAWRLPEIDSPAAAPAALQTHA